MKIRIEYTVEIDEDFRRAIRQHYGEAGFATRQEIKDWFRQYGESENDNLIWDLMYE